MNHSRVAEITQKFNGKGTNNLSLYTNQEVVDKLKEVQKIMLEGVFEKTHAEHMRDRDILRHFSSLADKYGLKETEIFRRFEANMNEMGYTIGSYIKDMKGEQIARRALKLLSYDPEVKILYNIALEDEDVQTEYDAIAITQYGLFVVEVKNWSDKMHIDEKGILSREDQDVTYDLADRMNIKEAMLKGYLGDLFPTNYQGFLLFPSGNVQIEDSYKKFSVCSGAGIVDEIRAMGELENCLACNSHVPYTQVVYTDFNCNEWNESMKYEYAEQAGKVGGKVLYVNSYCKDRNGDEIARGGSVLFLDGEIVKEIPSGKEDVLVVEV